MHKIDTIVLNGNLALKSSGGTTTRLSLNELEPSWWPKIRLMAMDRRHDSAPGILAYWTDKLENYSDDEICEAIKLHSGEFFPSVDDVISTIERRRELKAEETRQAAWPAWKARQARAEREGQMASEADYEMLRQKFKQIAFGAHMVRSTARPR